MGWNGRFVTRPQPEFSSGAQLSSCWLDVIACGYCGIQEWVKELRKAGFCMCTLKNKRAKLYAR